MNAPQLLETLRASPEWLPHSVDPATDRVLLVQLDAHGYDMASFLDARIFTPETRGQWASFATVIEAARPLPATARYIFHIGHVGSTLLSRLLAAGNAVLGVREPAALRTFADIAVGDAEHWWSPAMRGERLDALVRLWSRTWMRFAVVKATSVASELAGTLLDRADTPPALFMATAPGSYLATILGQDGNRAEANALGPARLRRLHRRIREPAFQYWSLSEGERIAMGWASELATLCEHESPQARWIDFDAFLADPFAGLSDASDHLGFAMSPLLVDGIVTGGEMRRYSKGPEHAYSPDLRREVLDQARRLHSDEIARGLRWLTTNAKRHQPIARALDRGTRLNAPSTSGPAPAAPAARG